MTEPAPFIMKHAIIALIVLIAGLQARSQPVDAQTADVIRDPEAYAVYAAVLPISFSSGDKDLTRIALLQETRPHFDCLPQGDRLEPDWHPVVENYRIENARVRTLQAGADLGLPYSLVPFAELSPLLAAARMKLLESNPYGGIVQSIGHEVWARYPNGKLLAFSAVGFNDTKTRALLTVKYNCDTESPGSACAGGRHIAMQKDGTRWVRNTKITMCFWIA